MRRPTLTTLIMIAACVLTLPLALAHAGADPSIPVTTGVDFTWDFALKYGVPWTVLLVFKGGLTSFLSKNESKHWIAQGKTLSILTGLGMVVTSLLSWRFLDAPSGGILTALVAAYTLVTHSTVPNKSTPSSIPAGTGTLVTLALLTLAFGHLACSSSMKQRGVATAGAALDCEVEDLRPLIQELVPLATNYVKSLLSPDGRSIDTTSLRKAWQTIKTDQGRCALAAAMEAMATPGAPGTASAALVADSAELHRAFAVVRQDHGWGDTRTAKGLW